MKTGFVSPELPNLVTVLPDSGFSVNIRVPSITKTEMQRPATHRRQVRNLRHAKPLTGIVEELPSRAKDPVSTRSKRHYRVNLPSSTPPRKPYDLYVGGKRTRLIRELMSAFGT